MTIRAALIHAAIVTAVATAPFILGIAPPDEVRSAPAAAAGALVTFCAWQVVRPRERRPAVGLVLLALSCVIAIVYALALNRLTFEYPPDHPTAQFVAGTRMTSAAGEFSTTHPGSAVAETVASFGGLRGRHLVWGDESMQSAKLILMLNLALLVCTFSAALLHLVRWAPAGSKPEVRQPPEQASSDLTAVSRLLFLAANPSDTTRLALQREVKEIKRRLLNAKAADKLLLEVSGALEPGELADQLLEHRPSAVHFSGHGSDAGQILVEDRDGVAVSLDKELVARLFGILRDTRCVLLNACYSEDQARLIAEHVPCVIGMSDAIDAESAMVFSAQFYSALAFGKSVKVAFELGCNQIALKGLPGSDTPKLLTQRGVDAESVVLLRRRG